MTAGPAGGITNVTAPPATAAPADVQVGGSVTWLTIAEITGLDPIRMFSNAGSDGTPGAMIYDLLVYSDGGTVTPGTAQSLTSSDGLVWTLRLRPSISFSDGTPYDAAAVKFNIQRLQDPNNKAARAAQAALIQSMDVIDPLTLRLTLKATNTVFPQALVLMPFIGSPTAIQAEGADRFTTAPVGAGPFLLKSWTRDSEMVLTRNPHYWNAPLPYVDQFTLKPLVDETQRLNTMCSGGATMAFISAVGNADQAQQRNCGVSRPIVLNGGIVLYFNNTTGITADPRLRQAVAAAIDPKDYSKVVTNGIIQPMLSIFDTKSPFYDPTIQQLPYDPTKAQQLFDQVAAANGGTVNLQMSTFALANFQNTGQYVQAVLNKFKNVHVDLTAESAPTHIANCNTRAYTGICISSTFFDDPEPVWTSGFACNSALNPTGYCNAKFDEATADNRATLDAARRITDIKNAQKIFYADVPAFFLEQRYNWIFTAPTVQNFHFVDDGVVLPDRLWLKTH